MKYPILITELLTNPIKGIVTQTTYYSDGSVEIKQVAKYPVIFIEKIRV